MPDLELNETAVEQFTQGRLVKDDPETSRLLAATLAAVRSYCGWHVTPVKTDDVVPMDGPGTQSLILPTLKLLSVGEIRERITLPGGGPHETVYLPADLEVSRRGIVLKRFTLAPHVSYPWWSSNLGSIDVKMTHGFTPEEAADFNGAVLSAIDRASTLVGGGPFKAIGPFVYGSGTAFGAGSQFSDAERATFDLYRLEPEP